MDHNKYNQPAQIKAMDLSVSSSSGAIELSATSGVGPISRLPNEMMHMIMAKLALDGDVKKLIRLRLVSAKWRALVEDYCGLKKSLCVQFRQKALSSEKLPDLPSFEEIFFGFTNGNKITCLLVSTKIPSEYLSSFLNMFANIEQLTIDCSGYYFYEPTPDSNLQVYINSHCTH